MYHKYMTDPELGNLLQIPKRLLILSFFVLWFQEKLTRKWDKLFILLRECVREELTRQSAIDFSVAQLPNATADKWLKKSESCSITNNDQY